LQARKDAGLEVSGLSARSLTALGLSGGSGVRTRGHARLDPVRACHGLARAAVVRGAGVFERTPVTKVKATRRGVEVVTAKAVITAETVILTTGDPSAGFHALDRHFSALETYVVQTPPLPTAVRSSMRTSDLIVQDLQQPSHLLYWTDDHRITWSGGDQARSPERGRDKVLVQRTGQLMYELSLAVNAISGIQPDYGWHAPYSRTVDGLPFIGPHRNYPGHLFALGLGTNLANAFLASRVLLRRYTSTVEKDDEAFGFMRLPR
jgi:glycine/D-amino acid oxidase-like deaminating enzyme